MDQGSVSPGGERYVSVALPLPVFEPYTYTVPETLADRVTVGSRVVVPVRRRELVGIVVATETGAPAVAARELLAAPDFEPTLARPLLRTAEWIAGYYGAPLGVTLRAMLPAPLWGESQLVLRATGHWSGRLGGLAEQLRDWVEEKQSVTLAAASRHFKRPLWEVADRLARVGAVELALVPAETEANVAVERRIELGEERLTLVERDQKFARRPKQRRLYETLEQLGGGGSLSHLQKELGFTPVVVKGLVDSGLAQTVALERSRDPFAGLAGTPPPERLTAEQETVVEALASQPPATGSLLFGVTGSGKTLVYLHAVRRALEAGQGAIILVPEIGLTPQMVNRVRGMFGDAVAVLHSALSDGERADAWRALRRGDRKVAVGARSAIFAPVQQLGVIVVDEEHETSYKNGEAPRYHAREVALVRAKLEGARYILGSATPSLESWSAATASTAATVLFRLPQRIDNRPLPPVHLLDLRAEPLIRTGHAVPWSEALDRALHGVLDRREQAILLLNRRGYAAFLQCPQCGFVPECPDCNIALTLHRVPPGLRCHYCARHFPVPARCERCNHAVQRAHGIGTQQLEELVAARFPRARLARMDLDTTSARWSHHRILEKIDRGEVDILLGTQMIAKGMDFPNVTLVGVVDADTALHLPDFRAAERTYQLLAQVAGRAGRGPKGGKVLVQTRSPEHPALRFAATHDTEGFLAYEAGVRKEPPYPPETSLLNVIVSAEAEATAMDAAIGAAGWLEKLIASQGLPLMLLGPAPCPLTRIQKRWRWHVLLRGPVEEIGRVVRYAAPRLEGSGKARVVLDRDPVSLL